MSRPNIPLALRRLVQLRARDRCEYCLLPESATFVPHGIDHVIALKHGGITDSENLANSCVLCNQYKGSDLSSIDPDKVKLEPLFHPRRDLWIAHFRYDGAIIVPLTATGRVTIRLLRLNDVERIQEREQLLAAGIQFNPADPDGS